MLRKLVLETSGLSSLARAHHAQTSVISGAGGTETARSCRLPSAEYCSIKEQKLADFRIGVMWTVYLEALTLGLQMLARDITYHIPFTVYNQI